MVGLPEPNKLCMILDDLTREAARPYTVPVYGNKRINWGYKNSVANSVLPSNCTYAQQ